MLLSVDSLTGAVNYPSRISGNVLQQICAYRVSERAAANRFWNGPTGYRSAMVALGNALSGEEHRPFERATTGFRRT